MLTYLKLNLQKLVILDINRVQISKRVLQRRLASLQYRICRLRRLKKRILKKIIQSNYKI